MFNIFGKVMLVAGVGLVFASAVNAIKKEQEENIETVNVTDEDGNVVETKEETISFKEAAKRKVAKFYRRVILWSVDHIQDIQVWTMALGLLGAFLNVASQIRDNSRSNMIAQKLDDIDKRMRSVEYTSGMSMGLSAQNTLFNATTFQYLDTNKKLTPEIINIATDMSLKTVDMCKKNLE